MKPGKKMAAISRTYERDGGFKIMLQENRKKAATLLLPGVSQRIVGGGGEEAFAGSFASFTLSSPRRLTPPSSLSAHALTQTSPSLFPLLQRNTSFLPTKAASPPPHSSSSSPSLVSHSHSQVPILSPVCLLYSPP